jgi:hypothetical protein
MPFPDIQPKPELGDGWVRFVQSAGGRTGAPAPRRIRRPPFVQWVAPAAWSTLALTIHADGRAAYEVVGASPFPRHWIYDHDGKLVAKTGPDRLRPLVPRDRDAAHPLGRRGLAGPDRGRRDGPGAAAVGGHHRRQAGFRRLEDGEVLVEQGETGTDVYLLFDGVLMVEIDGKPVTELGPGAVVGEMALLEGGKRTATLRAVTPCRDRRGRRRPARPRCPRRGGQGPPRTGQLTWPRPSRDGRPCASASGASILVLPLLGLWLLLAQPHFDVVLEHHGIHFALVVGVAAVNVALGVRMSEVSRQRADARLFLVSLVFLSSAGFLLLHALATPQVLLYGRNAGFTIATPIGLLLAAVFAALSSLDLTPSGPRPSCAARACSGAVWPWSCSPGRSCPCSGCHRWSPPCPRRPAGAR